MMRVGSTYQLINLSTDNAKGVCPHRDGGEHPSVWPDRSRCSSYNHHSAHRAALHGHKIHARFRHGKLA